MIHVEDHAAHSWMAREIIIIIIESFTAYKVGHNEDIEAGHQIDFFFTSDAGSCIVCLAVSWQARGSPPTIWKPFLGWVIILLPGQNPKHFCTRSNRDFAEHFSSEMKQMYTDRVVCVSLCFVSRVRGRYFLY